MSGSPILDTALGMCFVFLLGAVFTSAAVEWFANIIRKRAKNLLVGLRELLEPSASASTLHPAAATLAGVGLGLQNELYRSALRTSGGPGPTGSGTGPPWLTVEQIMGHGLIQPLKTPGPVGGKIRNPSYIPSETIAKVIVDLLLPVPTADQPTTFQDVVDKLATCPDGQLKSALLALAKSADGELESFRDGIQGWYDAQMDRVTGAYKRWAKKCSVMVAIIAVAFLNLDAIAIANSLWTDEAVRSAIVVAVDSKTCKDEQDDTAKAECVQSKVMELRSDGLPIGFEQWASARPDSAGAWALKLMGLALSVAAVSMGAPFWFEVMNKIINVRNAGARPVSQTSG